CHAYTVLPSSQVQGVIRIATGHSRLSKVRSSCSATVFCLSIMSCFLSLYRLFGLFNRLDSVLTCLRFSVRGCAITDEEEILMRSQQLDFLRGKPDRFLHLCSF